MDGVWQQIDAMQAAMDRDREILLGVASKQIADTLVLRAFVNAILPSTGLAENLIRILEGISTILTRHAAATPSMQEGVERMAEWISELSAACEDPSPPKTHSQRADEKLQQHLAELAAKQAAQRILLIGLAAHVGQASPPLSDITRGIEQATRDAKGALAKEPGGMLVVHELARMADDLRAKG